MLLLYKDMECFCYIRIYAVSENILTLRGIIAAPEWQTPADYNCFQPESFFSSKRQMPEAKDLEMQFFSEEKLINQECLCFGAEGSLFSSA